MIPLASDTESLPSAAMREAIAAAEVGDEQKGQDPTVNRLLARVCDLLGKEAALFLPSGTMCNLVAIKAHTRPGDVVLVERDAHITRAEAGGAALAAGIQIEGIAGQRGLFDAGMLARAVAGTQLAPSTHAPPATLVCVEQTHNYSGGSVWPLETMQEVAQQAHDLGLAVHVDGARLFNAAVASGVDAVEFAACADTLWIDFTKGLGAPVGAVLAGSADFIIEARRYKHAFGGALRQAGVVAAGCLHALDHHVDRLADDHRRASELASGLAAIGGIDLVNPEPETNIALFGAADLGLDAGAFVAACHEHGTGFSAVGEIIRAVTHLDVDDDGISGALAAVADVAGRRA